MKKILKIGIIGCILSINAFGMMYGMEKDEQIKNNHKEMKNKMAELSLEEQKVFFLKKIEEREKKVNEIKECIKKADTKENLKNCHPKKEERNIK